jgi:PPOX class probable F420-dependent enzyme
MPGYGVLGPTEGTGLLPWSWAEERLAAARNFWVTTLWPDGRPHLMPVWAVWDSETQLLWFTSSLPSRKVRNLAADPRCVAATEEANNPVVLEGIAEIVRDADSIARVIGMTNSKYETAYSVDFLDPAVNATIRLRPRWAFGLRHDDFTGSPTRWTFAE